MGAKAYDKLSKGYIAENEVKGMAFVMQGTNPNQVKACTGADVRAIGVVDGYAGEVFAAGKPVTVIIMGIARCRSGEALATIGTAVRVHDTDGYVEAVKAVGTQSTPQKQVGITLTPTSGDGDVLEVLLTPGANYTAHA